MAKASKTTDLNSLSTKALLDSPSERLAEVQINPQQITYYTEHINRLYPTIKSRIWFDSGTALQTELKLAEIDKALSTK